MVIKRSNGRVFKSKKSYHLIPSGIDQFFSFYSKFHRQWGDGAENILSKKQATEVI